MYLSSISIPICYFVLNNLFLLLIINIFRYVSTTHRLLSDKNESKKQNMSFVMNTFRGQLQPAQMFPYPEVLDSEQQETLAALIDPTSKFFEVITYI